MHKEKEMKVKVLAGFKDKYTGKRYYPGETIEVTQKRIDEILEKGKLVEPMPEEKEEGQQEEKPKAKTRKGKEQ